MSRSSNQTDSRRERREHEGVQFEVEVFTSIRIPGDRQARYFGNWYCRTCAQQGRQNSTGCEGPFRSTDKASEGATAAFMTHFGIVHRREGGNDAVGNHAGDAVFASVLGLDQARA